MQAAPVVVIHLAAALTATALGPIAIWARRGETPRPRLHQAAGYAWVTSMVVTALSALFIQGEKGPRWAGFSLIHLLIPVTLVSLYAAFRYLRRGNIAGHSQTMQSLYWGACVGAGVFTLLPERMLGRWLWGSLGLM